MSGGAIAPDHAAFLRIIEKRAGDLAARYRALEFWEVNQVAAAPLAAERRTPASLKRLRSVAEHLFKARDAWSRRAAEAELCLSVSAASNNPWLTNAVYDSLAATLLPFADCVGTHCEFARDAVDGLIDAIDRSDQDEATRHMHAIVLSYGRRLRPRRPGKRSGEHKGDLIVLRGDQATGATRADD